MDLKIEILENALQVAKELGLKTIPPIWLKLLESNWEIRKNTYECGSNWGWFRPTPSGELRGAKSSAGCVCHAEFSIRQLIELKKDASQITERRLQQLQSQKDPAERLADIGKIFYSHPGKETGQIVTRDEFLLMDPAYIGWWLEVNEFNCGD